MLQLNDVYIKNMNNNNNNNSKSPFKALATMETSDNIFYLKTTLGHTTNQDNLWSTTKWSFKCRVLLSAKMALLRPSADIHYVSTQKDNYD